MGKEIGWRERMLGKTAGIGGGAFGECCGNLVQWNLPGIYESDPNEHLRGGDMRLSWPSLITRQGSSGSTGLHSVFGQGVPRKITKQPKLLIRQKVGLLKLTAGPHCWEQHPHNFLNMEKYWTYAYMETLLLDSCSFGAGRFSPCYQKRDMDFKAATKPLTYNQSCL